MHEIKNPKSLEAWLETRPPDDARLIAARAALRALPGLVSLFEFEEIEDPYVLVLQVFRASAVVRVAGNGPTAHQQLLNAAHSAFSTADAAFSAFSARSAASAAFTTFSAFFATDAAFSARSSADATASAADAAFSAARSAARSANRSARSAARSTAISAAWTAVERDAEQLETSASHNRFWATPLWPDDPPQGLAEAWPTLRNRLLEVDRLWHVWTDWYQDRLDGIPINEALEIEQALIPDTDWEKGPSHVNAIIAQMIAKHPPELPEATPSPTQYVFTGEVLDASSPARVPFPNDATEVAWSVLRETLDGLKKGGISNSMRVAPAIDRTLSALGSTLDEIDIIRCGMAGMELQAFSEVADSVLMEDAAAMLKAAVAQHALLVAQFDDWRTFKAQLLPPLGGRDAEREAVHDAAHLHHEMAKDGLLSDTADARMSEEEAAALPEPAVTGEVVTAEPESERGFLRSIRAALRAFAVDVLNKMRGNAVATTAVAVPSVAAIALVRYSDTLAALAAKLPKEFEWVMRWVQWLQTVLP